MSQIQSLRLYCNLSPEEWVMGQGVTTHEFNRTYRKGNCSSDRGAADKAGQGDDVVSSSGSFAANHKNYGQDPFRAESA